MINSLTEAVSIALNAEFGAGYRVHREVKRQGLKEPCFFIQCLNPTQNLFLGKRYFRRNRFCIQYFPENKFNGNHECHTVAARLFSCLEYLKVGGDMVMGTKMNYEVTDGILNFFVNYDLFVYMAGETDPVMDGVSSGIQVKGQVKG